MITRLTSFVFGLGSLLFVVPSLAVGENQFDLRLPSISYERLRFDTVIYPKGAPKITSGFGATHDLAGKQRSRPNDGIDIVVPLGTLVYASVGGRVAKLEETDDGFRIEILRKMPVYQQGTVIFKRFIYAYANLSKIYVADGESVRAGQKIAEVGKSLGPHLHFSIRVNGRRGAAPFKDSIRAGKYYAIDPLYYLVGRKTNMILCRDKNRSVKYYRRVFKTAKHGYRLAYGMPLSLYPVACN